MKILIVEDEIKIAQLIQQILEPEGFTCHYVLDGLSALEAVKQIKPDLIILDLMLPGMDGLEVCTRIRQHDSNGDPYILMLTSKGEEMDCVIGLSTGADDYMVKPFGSRELVARVRAVLRRKLRNAEASQIYQTRHFTLDLTSHEAKQKLDDDFIALNLTTTEFNLLATFLSYPNRVWSRTQLIDKLWGNDFYGEERIIDTQIARLRKKIELDSSKPVFIKTVMGIGYKFEDNDSKI